jgi:hypothetical protein
MNARLLSLLVLGVATLWVLSWLLLVRLIPDAPTRGQFGDQFGSINALFSGLAFAVIFCSGERVDGGAPARL